MFIIGQVTVFVSKTFTCRNEKLRPGSPNTLTFSSAHYLALKRTTVLSTHEQISITTLNYSDDSEHSMSTRTRFECFYLYFIQIHTRNLSQMLFTFGTHISILGQPFGIFEKCPLSPLDNMAQQPTFFWKCKGHYFVVLQLILFYEQKEKYVTSHGNLHYSCQVLHYYLLSTYPNICYDC